MYNCAPNMHSATRGVRVGHLSQTSRAKPIRCHEAPWIPAPCDHANLRNRVTAENSSDRERAARQPSGLRHMSLSRDKFHGSALKPLRCVPALHAVDEKILSCELSNTSDNGNM